MMPSSLRNIFTFTQRYAAFLIVLPLGLIVGSGVYLGPYCAGLGFGAFGDGFGLCLLSFCGAIIFAIMFAGFALDCWRKDLRQSVALLCCGLVIGSFPFALFAIGGPGAKSFVDGFQHAILRRDLDAVQNWATQALQRHSENKLMLAPQPWNTFFGAPKLADSEIPSIVNAIWAEKPHYVAIENFGASGEKCVFISWYLHGIIVGPPGFKSTFGLQIRPGIYVFMHEK